VNHLPGINPTPDPTARVLRIRGWTRVYETSDSRKHKRLTWISCPVGFSSHGYQALIDDHDPHTAAALYGCWLALCKMAAEANQRGTLCSTNGEPWRLNRYARISGLPRDLFAKLIEWALNVGWLEYADHPADTIETTATNQQPVANRSATDQQSINNPPTPPPLITGPKPTKTPDKTPTDRQPIVNRSTTDRQSNYLTLPNQTKQNPTFSSAPGEGEVLISETQETPAATDDDAPPKTDPLNCSNAGPPGPASVESLPATPETWQTLTEALDRHGLTMAADAARNARRNGATPEHAHAVLRHWTAHPNAWSIGIVYHRFQNPTLCNLPPAAGWPTPASAVQTQQRDAAARATQSEADARLDSERQRAADSRAELAELLDRYGPEIDALPVETLLAMVPEKMHQKTLTKSGWRSTATLRTRILRTYATQHAHQ
jgi:hypothetical protein